MARVNRLTATPFLLPEGDDICHVETVTLIAKSSGDT
jgi:hypothetical protein